MEQAPIQHQSHNSDLSSTDDSDGEDAGANELKIRDSHQVDILATSAAVDHKGKKRAAGDVQITSQGTSDFDVFLEKLKRIVNLPPDSGNEYQHLKKDIFHAFHMIVVPLHHGMRAAFLRAMRDHLLCWDPVVRKKVDALPVPPAMFPSQVFLLRVLRAPLFNKAAWEKAASVIGLACEGYLSDIVGIKLYEKAGVDQFGLHLHRCIHGTNKVEGGPHADIYRKFGALHAGPRFTVNTLNDHRTHYNLQAFARHIFGVDWNYHHDIGLINWTSFLLNYLSDIVNGADSYSEWPNGDLYEQTTETFGICEFPEILRSKLNMRLYDDQITLTMKVNTNKEWLHHRQNLGLPILPPTTPAARKYFLMKKRELTLASVDISGRSKVDFTAFAAEWNMTADGKHQFYVTLEILSAYSKSWDEVENMQASEGIIQANSGRCSKAKRYLLHLPYPFHRI
ncbi:hypothetical protein V5O48_016044 [Marasmius crinis-equi]|uniref:Uncharacterized protein n=1 Tax=Marasmius crinis-equi TaxID=585013 RepID=A0ABR3ESZ2_9AGAR